MIWSTQLYPESRWFGTEMCIEGCTKTWHMIYIYIHIYIYIYIYIYIHILCIHKQFVILNIWLPVIVGQGFIGLGNMGRLLSTGFWSLAGHQSRRPWVVEVVQWPEIFWKLVTRLRVSGRIWAHLLPFWGDTVMSHDLNYFWWIIYIY
jgi:hypothetical protein